MSLKDGLRDGRRWKNSRGCSQSRMDRLGSFNLQHVAVIKYAKSKWYSRVWSTPAVTKWKPYTTSASNCVIHYITCSRPSYLSTVHSNVSTSRSALSDAQFVRAISASKTLPLWTRSTCSAELRGSSISCTCQAQNREIQSSAVDPCTGRNKNFAELNRLSLSKHRAGPASCGPPLICIPVINLR